MKNPRGYCVKIAITILGQYASFDLHPLVWHMPALVVPKSRAYWGWHLLLGPLHVWGMKRGHYFTEDFLGMDIGGGYSHYWWDKPVCPSGHRLVFGWMRKAGV